VALAALVAVALLVGERRPLRMVEIGPAAGATDVPVTAQVIATFSRPLHRSLPPDAMVLAPAVDGLLSASGRRVAFTPRRPLRADTRYAVTVDGRIRDAGGRALGGPVVSTFSTRPLALLARAGERGLVRVTLAGGRVDVVRGAVGAFAAAPSGAIASIDLRRHVLAVRRPRSAPVDLPIPDGLAVDAIEWTPAEDAVLFLGARRGEPGRPFVVRLDRAPSIRRLGDADEGGPLPGSLVIERLKRSLIEVVYGQDSYAVTRGAAIVRDRAWDFALVDLDGRRRATLGSFLAVGDAAPRGDAVLVVDVDPADPALRRQVAVYGRDGQRRALSAPDMDTHAPRFSHAGDQVVAVTAAADGPPPRRRYGLVVIQTGAADRRIVTAPPENMADGDPRWSPDDAWLVFRRTPLDASGSPEVWVVPAAGGEPRRLAADLDAARWVP
jgi:Big-like domain-containing protein/WD40 repeat protein